MMRHWLYQLTAHLPARLIRIDGQPYLERYYLGSLFGVTAYLHRFVAPDQDRHVHDHPWPWAASLILAGHYIEETVRWFTPSGGWQPHYVRRCWWRPNLLGARTLHRIHSAAPDTWTLFVHGRRCKRWGFLEPLTSQGKLIGAVYSQRLEDTASIGWEHTAPKGRDSARTPYPRQQDAFNPVAQAMADSAAQDD